MANFHPNPIFVGKARRRIFSEMKMTCFRCFELANMVYVVTQLPKCSSWQCLVDPWACNIKHYRFIIYSKLTYFVVC